MRHPPLRTLVLGLVFLCLVASTIVGPTASTASDPVLDVVTPRLLRAHLGFIADDELRGRRTPSRGLRIAARYIAAQLERAGARPAGDAGSYLQRVEMDPSADDGEATAHEARSTENVVAVIEGSDPRLRHEHVALGAHYDHVGVGTPDDGGDAIYNGADDDGSGTAALLALAEAFAAGPRPARSLLFVWHAGEEGGMWGSRHFVAHPTVPLEEIVAQINVDMIGRSRRPGDDEPDNRPLTGPNEVYVIGPRIMSADLDTLIEEVNAGYLDLELDREYDDRSHP
ncbi:MAG: M20/M25/M40 family metallo-hydrolase, partial [Acidobacteriota bacterium]